MKEDYEKYQCDFTHWYTPKGRGIQSVCLTCMLEQDHTGDHVWRGGDTIIEWSNNGY